MIINELLLSGLHPYHPQNSVCHSVQLENHPGPKGLATSTSINLNVKLLVNDYCIVL